MFVTNRGYPLGKVPVGGMSELDCQRGERDVLKYLSTKQPGIPPGTYLSVECRNSVLTEARAMF